jgi:hypothetical protein
VKSKTAEDHIRALLKVFDGYWTDEARQTIKAAEKFLEQKGKKK